jgi:hypothetical protein
MGAGAAGWLSEREGLEGVVGDAGDDGRAGDEKEREPRLPPPDARAQTSVAVRTSPNRVTRLMMARSFRVFI